MNDQASYAQTDTTQTDQMENAEAAAGTREEE